MSGTHVIPNSRIAAVTCTTINVGQAVTVLKICFCISMYFCKSMAMISKYESKLDVIDFVTGLAIQ